MLLTTTVLYRQWKLFSANLNIGIVCWANRSGHTNQANAWFLSILKGKPSIFPSIPLLTKTDTPKRKPLHFVTSRMTSSYLDVVLFFLVDRHVFLTGTALKPAQYQPLVKQVCILHHSSHRFLFSLDHSVNRFMCLKKTTCLVCALLTQKVELSIIQLTKLEDSNLKFIFNNPIFFRS